MNANANASVGYLAGWMVAEPDASSGTCVIYATYYWYAAYNKIYT